MRVSSPHLVGRREELARLGASLGGALSGAPALFLVGGEAGVGKSRLIGELERRARDHGALVLHGECADLVGDELPYAPLIAALRGVPERVQSAMAAMPDAVRDELGRLLPSSNGLVTEGTVRGLAQTRLFELLLGLLRQLASDGGLLLVVEDLHWSDSSTRHFLNHFVRNVTTERVGVAVTWRTDEPARESQALHDQIGELQRLEHVECMVLSRFSPAEIRELLHEILGHLPEARLVDELYARSEGNPFYAEELLAVRGGGSDGLPEHLRDPLLVRVKRLPDSVQELMRALAAFGRPARQELLGEVAGVPEPGLSRELRKAAALHVLSHASGELLAFRHALVREAVYDDLLPGERRGLHLAIAEAMKRQDEQPDPAELANHWWRAGRVDEARRASIDAGLAATAMRAFDEALAHFERALEHWHGERVEDGTDRIDVLAHAAEAAHQAGDPDRAVTLCHQALEVLDAEAEPVRAAQFHERIGSYRFWDFQTSVPAFGEALRLLPDEPRADRARVLGDQGLALMLMIRWSDARARCEEAITVARAAGARLEETYARTTLGLVLAYLGATEDGERQLRRALEIAEECEYAEGLARGRIHLSEVLRLQGRLADALSGLEQGVREAKRLGAEGVGRSMAADATEDLFMLGRWDEAQQRLEELASLPMSRVGALMRDASAGHLAVARGEFGAALEHFEAARQQGEQGVPPEFLPTVGTGLAAVALGRGRLEEARAHVEQALAGLPDTEERLYTPMLLAMGARVYAELALQAGVGHTDAGTPHAERAAALLASLERLLEGVQLGPPPPIALAYLAECRAEAARAAGSASAAAWTECAERWSELSCPYAEAYARFRMAEAMLLEGAPRSQAAAPLRVAGRLTARLGARPLQGEIEALARRCRLDLEEPTSDSPAPPGPAFDLTKRELQVLPLLADGLTNQQIAGRLFISPHTVGVHVSHILSKLDVDNRVAAAAAAHRAGLMASAQPEGPAPDQRREPDHTRSVIPR